MIFSFCQALSAGIVLVVVASSVLVRLVGAVLAEQTDEWAEARRYIGLEILAKARAAIDRPIASEEVTAGVISA